jgi:hypothetical protein
MQIATDAIQIIHVSRSRILRFEEFCVLGYNDVYFIEICRCFGGTCPSIFNVEE